MKPSARRVRDRLRQGPATTHELCQPEVGGIRFGGRIEELRNDEGYKIDRKFLRTGSHLYTLVAEPAQAEPTEPPTQLPTGVVPVRAHSRRVHPEPVAVQLTLDDALQAVA